MEEFIEEALEEGVKLLLVQPQFSQTAAKAIAVAIHGKVETINPMSYDWEENLRNLTDWIETSYQG